MNNVELTASASPSTEYANLLEQEKPLLVDRRQQSQITLLILQYSNNPLIS